MPPRRAQSTGEQSTGQAGLPEVTIVAHDVGAVGGMERVLAELITGLRALGHRVTVIARTCELAPDPGIVFHRVRGPARPLPLALPWFMLAGSLAVRRRRRGVVQATGAIVLNRVDVIAVHYCHRVGPGNPSRAKPLYRLNTRLMGAVNLLAEKLCYRSSRARRFVCVSDGVAEEMRRYYPGVASRVLTIYNGVDTDHFRPGARSQQAGALREQLGIGGERLIAAFVGSEWPRKGLAPLIRALALAPGWDLVVAGRGDESAYRELAGSLAVAGSVHWLGVMSDIQLVYALADAFVLPTSYETFSLVTFEAAASGLAVLATPVSGVRDLIEDGRNGFLITREPRTIADRLLELAADPALRENLGRAARASALGFSWTRTVSLHHELYMSLAASSGAAESRPAIEPD
jgi:UDP-glucose:(heptosyl)LPS alpha-1,3-glucosyltransferase